jgi:hypothetical protein
MQDIKLTEELRNQIVEKLIEHDINIIRIDIINEDHEYIWSILTGNGWTQYNNLTDKQIVDEFNEVSEDLIKEEIIDQLEFEEIKNKILKENPKKVENKPKPRCR